MSQSKYSHQCSVLNGYDFDPTVTSTIGFVYAGKLNDNPLDKCFKIEDPEGKDKEVVAIMSFADWVGRETKPVEFEFGVNDALDAKLQSARATGMPKDDMEIEFIVWKYDPVAKQWYKAFYTEDGTPLVGALKTRIGMDNATERELDPMGISSELQEPRTHMWRAVMKIQGAQKVGGATSMGDKWMAKIGTDQV